MGDIKGDTRSLDYGSYELVETHPSVHVRLQVVGLAVQSCPICFSHVAISGPRPMRMNKQQSFTCRVVAL